MKHLVLVLVLAACEKTPAPQPQVTKPVPRDAAASSEVEASMAEFVAYTESVFVIMREHGKDCDEAARLLAPRAAVFAELAPRMMKLKESMQALPEAERDRIKHATDQSMEAFKARNADVEAIEAMGKACEKSSPAFAEIAPKVMFTKKK
jgi:hypothetical protein